MAKGSGITKELKCSPELREFLGEKRIARGKLMKKIWRHIEKKELKTEEDGRIIRVDSKLQPFLGKISKDKRTIEMRGKKIKIPAGHVFMTEIAGGFSKHLG